MQKPALLLLFSISVLLSCLFLPYYRHYEPFASNVCLTRPKDSPNQPSNNNSTVLQSGMDVMLRYYVGDSYYPRNWKDHAVRFIKVHDSKAGLGSEIQFESNFVLIQNVGDGRYWYANADNTIGFSAALPMEIGAFKNNLQNKFLFVIQFKEGYSKTSIYNCDHSRVSLCKIKSVLSPNKFVGQVNRNGSFKWDQTSWKFYMCQIYWNGCEEPLPGEW